MRVSTYPSIMLIMLPRPILSNSHSPLFTERKHRRAVQPNSSTLTCRIRPYTQLFCKARYIRSVRQPGRKSHTLAFLIFVSDDNNPSLQRQVGVRPCTPSLRNYVNMTAEKQVFGSSVDLVRTYNMRGTSTLWL
jgi:hypothetical protein